MSREVKRIQWIDYLKGLCMVSIIMHHLAWPEWYARFLYPFELAGFFFVSGYMYNVKSSFQDFLVVKVRTLLVPVLIFGLLNTILSYIYPGSVFTERLIGLIVQLPGRWDDLWFVACLFTMSLIFYPIVKYAKSSVSKSVIVAALAITSALYTYGDTPDLPWHLQNACVFLPFMLLGYMAKRTNVGSKILEKLRTGRALLLILICYLPLIFICRNYPIDVHILNYGNLHVFYLSALLGTSLILSVAMNLECRFGARGLKWLQYIGKNTLVYYAFQSKVITIVIAALAALNISTSSYAANFLTALLVCVVLIIPVEFINRICPFLLGRQNKHK